ncbi:hypothetical protein D9756_002357 [Leucocoprinus leucothites]|uniref:Transcription factor BYE1 n=1 Tax=Leucocoprinus leucothites TaxID=201217 RepID=A0A8H5GCP2_9AGAR|nr:hypothetical protein D9756_002357 [Leucoagaricus leucothites]
MSTRARTRAAAAAAAAAASSATSPTSTSHAPTATPNSKSASAVAKGKRKPTGKETTIPTSVKQEQPSTDPSAEKENIKTASSNTTTRPSTTNASKKQSQAKSKSTPKANSAYCICSRGDDGSPMIRCAECKIWYHFICVDLSEREAEEINVYICSPCTQFTGRKTAMVWEGMDALEDCGSEEETIPVTATTKSVGATATTTPTVISKGSTKQKPKRPAVSVSLPPPPRPQLPLGESDDEGDPGSEDDDYVAEDEESKSKTKGKRRLRRISSSGSSSSEAESTTAPSKQRSQRRPTKLRKLSSRSQTPVSPALTSATTPTISTSKPSRLKRKSSTAEKETSSSVPAPKRKKSDATGGGGVNDDAVRKYCLGKFEDVFRDVFLRYPYVRALPTGEGGEGSGGDVKMEEGQAQSSTTANGAIVMKKLEELSEEEKESLIGDSKRFAAELEQCVFDIYAEGDVAGAKYKDRFRTLQFNLSKPDRTVIHQRIITRTITPKEISLMSSTDLADEETKQHIKIAEKESLEQTILQKPTVPRAKITHKGLQDIEDVNGDLARARELERQRDREQEEEEKRERERRERQKAVEKQRQRTQSLSVPPESPVAPTHSPITPDQQQQQTWGAPPPVPAHVLQQQQQGAGGPADDILHPSIRPLFVHTMSDVVMASVPEPELNLADLINIDEDGAEQDGSAAAAADTTATGAPDSSGDGITAAADTATSSAGVPAPPPLDHSIEPDGSISERPPGAHHTVSELGHHLTASPTSPTTPSSSVVSPFSATRPRGLSFDLNSLWQNAPRDEDDISRTPKSPLQNQEQGVTSLVLDADKDNGTRGRKAEDADSGDTAGTKSLIHGIGGDGARDHLVMEPEPMEVANDDDFDMFLAEEKEDMVDRAGAGGTVAPGGGNATSKPPVSQDPEAAFEAIQQCWTGKIHMPPEWAAPQSTTVIAKQIGGRSLGHQSLLWKTLIPVEDLRIEGRVATKDSEEFLTQVRLNPTRELIAVAFSPVSEEMKPDFEGLIEFFKSRDRHGLIFPWGQRPKDVCPGRELYVIPLRANEPLPEYVELLDELRIPKTRKADFLIGVWVLFRGKLSHPPPQPPSGTPATASSATPAPVTPTVPAPPMPNIPPLPPHLASAKSQSPPVPTPSAVTPGAPSAPSRLPPGLPIPPQINPVALEAEVASLTQEQVQHLIHSLTASGFQLGASAPGGSGPAAPPQAVPVPGQPPHGSHLPPPPPPSHPWPGYPIPGGPPPSQPPGIYPPPPGPMYGHPPPPPHSHPYAPSPPPHHGPSDHDRRDSYGSPHGHYGGGRGGDRDRGDRGGWRGGGGGGGRGQRGRGKHRGGGGGGGNSSHRPVDSGWPRRQRNEDGNGSPGRRWG